MQNALKLAYEHLASQKIFLGSLALAMIGSREGIAYPPPEIPGSATVWL
jgi:hypothetical protein